MMEVDYAPAPVRVAPRKAKARGRKRPRRTRRAAQQEDLSEPAWRHVKRPANMKAGWRRSSRKASAEATQKIYYCLTAFWVVSCTNRS